MAASPADTWKVKTRPEAQRDLDQLSDPVRAEALAAIEDLAYDPFPPDSIPLRGHARRYRIKFYSSRCRIIYDALENRRTIRIFRVRPRQDAYRGL